MEEPEGDGIVSYSGEGPNPSHTEGLKIKQ